MSKLMKCSDVIGQKGNLWGKNIRIGLPAAKQSKFPDLKDESVPYRLPIFKQRPR
jgi:hypothetical protein